MGIVSRLKSNFVSGLLILLPLVITLLVVKFFASYALLVINPIVQSTNLVQFTGNLEALAQVIAVFLVVSSITILGYLSNSRGTERIRKRIIRLVEDIPVFGSIYSTVNQISSSFRGENSKFKEIVLVEFPKTGIYSLGLITSEAPETVEESVGKDSGEMKTIYIPYSPNPTMGNLIMVPEDSYRSLDMSIQKGMKLLLTTGIAHREDEIPEEIQERKI